MKDEFLIVKKAVKRYPFLKKVEPKKLAPLYYAWGIVLLKRGKKEEAKRKLIKAVRCKPIKVKAALAYIAPAVYKTILNHYVNLDYGIHMGLKWLEG